MLSRWYCYVKYSFLRLCASEYVIEVFFCDEVDVKYLTIDDVCEMLSISRRTLERMRLDTGSGALTNVLEGRRLTSSSFNIANRSSVTGKKTSFPEPDLYIGKSPRWEQDKLISWLEENGRYL